MINVEGFRDTLCLRCAGGEKQDACPATTATTTTTNQPTNYPLPLPLHSFVQIKVADFGLSNTVSNGSRARTPVGTPLYSAPEVLFPHLYPHLVEKRSCGRPTGALSGCAPSGTNHNNGGGASTSSAGGDHNIVNNGTCTYSNIFVL